MYLNILNLINNKSKKILTALESTIKTIKYCMDLSWRTSKIYTISRIIIECVNPLIPLVLSYLGKLVIDILVQGNIEKSLNRLLFIFSLTLLILLILTIVDRWREYATNEHSELIKKHIIHQQIENAMKMDLVFFDKPEWYDKLVSSFRDSEAVAEEVWYVLNFLSSIIAIGGTIFLAIRVTPVYALILLVVNAPPVIISLSFTKQLYQLSISQINEGRESSLLQSLSSDKRYAQDFRLFNSKSYVLKKHESIWNKLFYERRNVLRKRNLYLVIFEILPIVSLCGISLDLALRVLQHQNTVGDYTFYTNLFLQVRNGMSGIGISIIALYENRLKFKNLQSFFSYENTIVDGDCELEEQIQEIKFEHVSFRYNDESPLVLDDINLHIHSKETIALVGLNGSGKSTLIKLLLRFYDPTEGRILINGTDIRKFSLEHLRSRFSVYFQNMLNFPFSIRENYMISDNAFSLNDQQEGKSVIFSENFDRRAIKAMESAACTDFFNKAKRGMNHNITRLFDSEGLELSVGQNQKFALSRAFFRKHQVLILDEPTSNVDIKSERVILKWVQQEASQHIVLWISHNFTNVHAADKIILLENGRIIEEGSHQELLDKNGEYAVLYRYQEEKLLRK
ncbi:MAG: ABC transporter ATP-binding protein [Eubacteriales bacterium]|nr:ABC transporter ATP-binding protein [Clostridiales bacterium]MDY5835846.1 ABC transporter ATP-binding protein [Eubacteriales bacterium]